MDFHFIREHQTVIAAVVDDRCRNLYRMLLLFDNFQANLYNVLQ